MNAGMLALLDLARAAGFVVRARGPRAELRAGGRLVAVVTDPAPDLCSTAEAGELLGVSRQRVLQLRDTHADFPVPAQAGRGLVWSREALARWARSHRRDVPVREAS